MRDAINSQGLLRKDDINSELARFHEYKRELLSLIPINTPEKADKMKDVLLRHTSIDVNRLIGLKV